MRRRRYATKKFRTPPDPALKGSSLPTFYGFASGIVRHRFGCFVWPSMDLGIPRDRTSTSLRRTCGWWPGEWTATVSCYNNVGWDKLAHASAGPPCSIGGPALRWSHPATTLGGWVAGVESSSPQRSCPGTRAIASWELVLLDCRHPRHNVKSWGLADSTPATRTPASAGPARAQPCYGSARFSRTCSLKRAEKSVCHTSHHHVNVVANKMPAEGRQGSKEKRPARMYAESLKKCG